MTDYLEGIAAFEAAGGRFSLEDGHVRVTYPKARQEALMPVLTVLRAHRVDVERLILDRVGIHSAQHPSAQGEGAEIHSADAFASYTGRMNETEAKPAETGSRRGSQPRPEPSARYPTKDIELALRVIACLKAPLAHQSFTASELAERLHGRGYTLDHVIEIYRVCGLLCEARILVPGRDRYGYQLSC